MKRIAITVYIVLILVGTPHVPNACTSFAVYSDKTVYGMNFDYLPDARLKFTIASSVQGNVFQMGSLVPFGFAQLVGMNSKGLFAACQMLFPEGSSPLEQSDNQISSGVFQHISLYRFENVSQVKNFLRERKVVHSIGASLHNLVADRFGEAMVVEVGDAENKITGIEDRYMVMTNFPNHQLQGKSYDEAEGMGAERFKIVHRYIKGNFKDFNIEKGIEVLKLAQNRSGTYTTRCAMVFDPDEKEIYICLENNFEKIWKVSLENQTIETYRGFASFKRQPIPVEGLRALALAEW